MLDRNGLTRSEDSRLEMGGTVAIYLVVAPNSFRNKLIESVEKVHTDLLVVVLVDDNRRSSMGDVHAAETFVKLRGSHRFGNLRGEIDNFVLFIGADFQFHSLLRLGRRCLSKASGLAPFSDICGYARLLHKRLREKGLVYHISPPTLADNFLGLVPQIRNKFVYILMHLDIDPAVQHADLDRLIDEFPRATDTDHIEKLRNVLGIETDASVGYQAANRPGIVRIVDRIQGQGQIDAILPHWIVGRSGGDHVLGPAFVLDSLFLDRFRNDPNRIRRFPTDLKLRLRSRPIFTAKTNRQGDHKASAKLL